jgi:hypothetical protein
MARFLLECAAGRCFVTFGRPVARSAILAAVVLFVVSGIWEVADTAYAMQQSHLGVRYDQAEVDRLIASGGTAFYADDTTMLAFFTHGALARPARFVGISSDSPAAQEDIAALPSPFYLVAASPAERELHLSGSAYASVTLREPLPGETIWLRILNEGRPGALRVTSAGVEKRIAAASGEVWLAVPMAGESVKLQADSYFSSFYLTGMRIDPESGSSWPWNHKVSLVYRHFRSSSFEFDPMTLSHGLFASVWPLDENGSALLGLVRLGS